MKKLFALLLAACCLFSMTGCATITTAFLNKAVEEITEETTAEESVYVPEATPETSAEVIESEAPADEPAAEPTAEPTPEPTPEPSAEDIVYTAHEVHLQGADSVGNEYDVTYRIPAFSLANEDALEANEDLMEWLMPYIEEQQANDAAGYSILISRLDYEVWVWEDVLTLQITVDTDWSQSYFKIYSVDINTGEFLDNEDILEKLGFTPDVIYEMICSAMETRYDPAKISVELDFLRQQLESTLAEENLEEATLFIGKDGQPMLHLTVYPLAGPSTCETIIELPQF